MSQRPIVLSLTKMHEAGLSVLREQSELRMASGIDPETLGREIVGVDGLIIRTGGVIDAALLDHADRLRVVGRHGVGYDQIDIPAATARGIQVIYTPGANTQSVCEHVFAMMIGLSKHFPQMMAALAAGNYHARTSMMGRDLLGRTIGIIGFGRIGRRVGEVAKSAFGMRVLYHDIVAAPPEVEARAGATRVSLDELAASEIRDGPHSARREHPAYDQSRNPGQDAARRDFDQRGPRTNHRRSRRRRGSRCQTALGLRGRCLRS